jgi:putative acetyltransferase
VSQLRPLEPAEAERAGYSAAWQVASGSDLHCAGLWEGGALVGAVRVAAMRRARRSYLGEVQLRADTPARAAALLEAVCAHVDGWTALDRLQLDLAEGDPAVESAEAHGFALEVRRAGRFGPGEDELVFGRLRPGFVPRPPGPPPPWPPRGRRLARDVSFRLIQLEDSAALRDLSTDPTAVWGTLQTPWSNERFYAERHLATGPEHEIVALVADGELAGTGSLHPTRLPGVLGLGMGLASAWQGCGLGARLLDELILRAWRRGARRVELGVWEDNTRARALYVSRGFVPEGLLRCDGIRGGGHAHTLEMALMRPHSPNRVG